MFILRTSYHILRPSIIGDISLLAHVSLTIMSQQSEDPSSILFNFDSASNIVNFDEDYEDDSDGTLLGDEFEDRFVRPTPEVIFLRDRDIPSNFEDNTDKRLGSYSFNNRTFRPGKTVELVSGDFLRITAIVHDVGSHSVCLKGIKFRRNKELNGLVEFKRNEVTMLMSFDDDDPRDIHHQSIETVQLREVVRLRELIKTNLPFPKYSFRESDENWRSQGKEYVMQHSRLLCRTKLIRRSNSEGTLQTLGEGETDEGYRTDDSQLRCDFRGETEKGGICARWLDGERDFDERERVRVQDIDLLNFSNYYNTWARNNSQQRRYTFGDAFCGAGGASRGAKAVGLRVDWGFDFDPAAIDSYRRNFHKTRCEAIAAHEFVTVITEDFKIDILHLSPPCQTFSPMHSRQGKNDELNQGTFFAVEELLKKVKPRIVTLEETFGLTRTLDNLDWFHAMIQVFTKLGFSVRWKIFNLCDFGLPQPRKRLFVFASW